MRIIPRLSARENYVASILVIAMILPPALILIGPVLAGVFPDRWLVELAQVVVAVLVSLLVGALLRRSPKMRPGVTWLAYARALLVLAIFDCCRGFLVLVSGRSPSRYSSFRVPRSDAVWEFGLSVAFGLLAAVAGLIGERSRTRS